jgi:NAD+ kinase
MKFKKIGILADSSEVAQRALKRLVKKYSRLKIIEDSTSLKNIDAIVVLGGDGFMLHTLHNHIKDGIPIYGMNKGTVGFLLNEYSEVDLYQRLEEARDTKIHPLKMLCTKPDGEVFEALAINEVSLLRTTSQAAKIRIKIDGTTYLSEMICDGVLVATPAGSSAYNYSNGGQILPINSNLLSLTPISPFRPRRWRGAVLPHQAEIELEVLRYWKRPVKAVADNLEIENVTKIVITEEREYTIHLLFDHGHSLEDRIMREQFAFN